MAEFDLFDVSGMAEVREAGVSLGQANLLRSLLNRHRREKDRTAIRQPGAGIADPASVSHAGAYMTDNARSNTANVKDMLDRNTNTPHTEADVESLLHQLFIKDLRQHPEIDHAGKLWDFLLDKPQPDPLMNTVPGEVARLKTGYVDPAPNISHYDPRAILVMRASSNKTIHITSFLSEETKKRLRNKRQQYLVQQGESLTMKVRDEHPYAGISILEYGAANMRLMNHLLRSGKLSRDKVEYYLAYTTLIFELGDKYEWRDVLNFDFQYRERQEEIGFEWGAMVSIMELQLLSGSKSRNNLPIDKPKWIPRGGKLKVEICRNFANTGQCNYGENCKFKHVDRTVPPRGSQVGQQAGLLPQPGNRQQPVSH